MEDDTSPILSELNLFSQQVNLLDECVATDITQPDHDIPQPIASVSPHLARQLLHNDAAPLRLGTFLLRVSPQGCRQTVMPGLHFAATSEEAPDSIRVEHCIAATLHTCLVSLLRRTSFQRTGADVNSTFAVLPMAQ